MTSRALLLAALVVLLLPVAVGAEDGVSRVEKTGRTRVAREMLSLARFCVRYKAYEDARRHVRTGLAVSPGNEKLEKELAKLADKLSDKGGAPKASFAKKYGAARTRAFKKCGDALVKVALHFKKSGDSEAFQRFVALIESHFPTDGALDKLGVVWFAPYLTQVTKDDAGKLEKGGERWEGEWLSPDAVKDLNRRHATWADPWVVSDEAHELRTTLPLRTARHLLAYVGAWSAYLLRELGGQWDLRLPDGKLPIIVTATQADMGRQVAKAVEALGGGSIPGASGAAFYMWTNSALNPCFVTLEPKDVSGTTIKVGVDDVLLPLRHEVTHQIAFECSKHDCDDTRRIRDHFWSVEGLANFMEFYELRDRGRRWELTHPRTVKMGSGAIEGAFAACVRMKRSLPKLSAFMAIPSDQFPTVDNYHIAATLAYYLLHGDEGKHRASFLKLLETVHEVKSTPTSFEDAFGTSPDALQSGWLAFVDAIELDD